MAKQTAIAPKPKPIIQALMDDLTAAEEKLAGLTARVEAQADGLDNLSKRLAAVENAFPEGSL